MNSETADNDLGRQLLERHVMSAQAYSEALGRGYALVPGQRPIASVWNRYYKDEMKRLEHERDEAEAAFMEWLRRPRTR